MSQTCDKPTKKKIKFIQKILPDEDNYYKVGDNIELIKNIARDMDIQLTTGGNKHTKQELVEAIIKFANYE